MSTVAGEVLFFSAQQERAVPPAPDGCSVRVWQPAGLHWIPPGTSGPKWIVWRLFQVAGIFSSRDYAVVQIWRGTQLAHRSSVFPRYFRFPFMQPSDLQVGDTWTRESERGRGLAVAGLLTALAWARGRRVWYLTTAANEASIRVARRAGFRLAGTGVRRPAFGIGVLGAYQLVHPAAPEAR
jgi:RimJ/RimL family protein N-acetyltransferase